MELFIIYVFNFLFQQECVEGCRCNPGYLIEDESGLCVKPKKCKSSKVYKKQQKQEVQPPCSGYCT